MGSGVFSGCNDLESVSVTCNEDSFTISSQSFSGCNSLSSLTIVSKVASVDANAFSGNAALKSVYISSDEITVGEMSFQSCEKISSLSLLSNKTTLGNAAFRGCKGIKTFTLSADEISFGDFAFATCEGLPSLTISADVVSFGEYCFQDCISLTSVNISANDLSIKKHTFSTCKSLESVVLSSDTMSIGEYSFLACEDLTNASFSSNTMSIGENAFDGCDSLSSITYLGTGIPECSEKLFPKTVKLESMCVPIDFNSSTFCGVDLHLNSTMASPYRGHKNLCVDVIVCGEEDVRVTPKESALLWESQVNDSGCVKYVCDNDEGRVIRSKCNESETCVDNECIVESPPYSSSYSSYSSSYPSYTSYPSYSSSSYSSSYPSYSSSSSSSEEGCADVMSGCLEYECINRELQVVGSKCNDTEVCVNDSCVLRSSFEDDDGYTIEMKVDNMKMEDFNADDIVNSIVNDFF